MKKKKIVSILLTLVMVLTLIPSMAVTSQAASYDPSPSWVLIGNHDGIKKSDQEWYAEMRAALEKDGTAYIRLATDIAVNSKGDSDKAKKIADIKVKGNKVIDLAGKKLDITIYETTFMGNIYKAFTITKDAELTVVDSNGSGRIWGDSYIRAADSQQTVNNNTVHIFDVENGGKLVISASGATIETGRSKEQYVNRAYIDGNHNDRHTGNVRNQTNGSVVIARLGSSVVINAGKLIARGYPRFASNDIWATRCAAVDIYSGSHILINNGELRGMGCADVINYHSNSSIGNPYDIKIRSAKLVRHKVDWLVIQKSGGSTNVTEGSYGSFIFIGDKYRDSLFAEGSEYVQQDKENVVIRPKSETVYTSRNILKMKWNDRSTSEYLDFWNGTESKMVEIDYQIYYPESEHHWIGTTVEYLKNNALGDDYSSSAMWYNELTFTLTNGSGKTIGEYNTSLPEKRTGGGYYLNQMFPGIASKLSMGETCILRATVKEI